MSWVFTILIGMVTAAAGAVSAGWMAAIAGGWHRVSTREGAFGYFVVFFGLVGLVVGLILGMVISRVVGADSLPAHLRALGTSLAVLLLLVALAGGAAWLTADFPPTLDGRPLDLQVEVRLPPDFELPSADAAGNAWVTLFSGQSSAGTGSLQLDAANRVDGRWTAPATLAMLSSRAERRLVVAIGDRPSQYIPVPLPGQPTQVDTAWSAWFPAAYHGDLSEVAPETAYEARYRVQPREAE